MKKVLNHKIKKSDNVLFSDNIDFNEYKELENEKKGEKYPFETLDLIISLKEKNNEV